MRIIVGVSDMKLSTSASDVLVTHALGSCIGITIYDSEAGVGGMLHFMLPQSRIDEKKAANNPFMFGDVGIPRLFREAYKLGAKKENLRVVIAGGAQVLAKSDFFAIGKRNEIMARKMFWKNNVLIAAEHVGNVIPRTLYLEMKTGESWIVSNGNRIDL